MKTTKYEEAIELLNNRKSVWIQHTFQDWNYKIANRRYKQNRQYGWFICQNKLIVCCHGGESNAIEIMNGQIRSISWITKKFGHLAKKYNNTIYIDCCYGATKECTVDGIHIIPINFSRQPSVSIAGKKLWLCSNTKDFDNYYNKIVKVFRVSIKIVEANGINSTEAYYKINPKPKTKSQR